MSSIINIIEDDPRLFGLEGRKYGTIRYPHKFPSAIGHEEVNNRLLLKCTQKDELNMFINTKHKHIHICY
jgi:hypothetical protein